MKPLHLIFVCSLVFLVSCSSSSDNSSPADTDGDGVSDNVDAFPNDPAETTDTDGDGVGDNADVFPNDPSETTDTDSDGVGDNADAFPNDPSETTDTDNDGVGDNADVDDDNNGLIEISSLEQLDWIRNNLAGTSLDDGISLNGSDEGCYIVTGCNGYELTQDLDFDTNGDGVMNADDTYYDYDGDSSNSGWLPIGTEAAPFTAIFDGNDFEVFNLYINRAATDAETSGENIGLFGYVNRTSTNAEIRNIGLTGELMSVTGDKYTGGLIGTADYTNITASYATGEVTGDKDAGGLIGNAYETNITASYATGSVTGDSYTGGFAGVSAYSSITASYATGTVTGVNNTGGFVGEIGFGSIVASYATGAVIGSNYTGGFAGSSFNGLVAGHWATDNSGQIEAIGDNSGTTDDSIGATLDQLQCPTSANNIICLSETTGETLYAGWDAIDHDSDSATDPISPWVFGDSDTLPTLSFD
ncbi:GLUG motif-containing protein [Reinekea thalattae]|uniref:MFS transporter n=1 Tax=Reinekea thalattae TaxID=2593301 RepID=A0A5C8Z9I2_9GAMM|nr:GLUG motif-containing protein [Reinekea thalattae]TXR53811.1 MFS transporter [Reinekea thalattae]